jgi:hypothetical protein
VPVIPRGSVLRVRIDQALDTRRNRAGDHFYASLAAPVLVHGSRNAIWALSGEAPGWEPPLAPSPAGERAHWSVLQRARPREPLAPLPQANSR